MANLLLALDKQSIVHDGSYTDVIGNIKEYTLTKIQEKKLEDDNFISEMWKAFDSLIDWGDYDFFDYEKCKRLSLWTKEKIKVTNDLDLLDFYNTLLKFATQAVTLQTGIGFEF